MEALIEALKIFLKYGNPSKPTHCEHDVLYICGISPDDVTDSDKAKLNDLGFFIDEEEDCFKSFGFGSA